MPMRIAIINKSTNNKCWRGCGQNGTLLHSWRECKLAQLLRSTAWRYLTKLYIELPRGPATPLLGIYPTKTFLKKAHAPTCSLQHYAQWPRHGNNPNAHQQMIGLGRCGIYTQMEYYSAIKKNEIMPFAATWMELETLLLSEVSKKEKDKFHMISLM